MAELTALQKKLVDTLVAMDSQGMATTVGELRKISPNHSSRDYAAAMHWYNDMQMAERMLAQDMPEELRRSCQSLLLTMWARICEYSERKIEQIRQALQKQVDDARLAARVSEARCEELEHKLEEARKREQELEKRISVAEAENKRLTGEHTELRIEHERLKGRAESQAAVIECLNRDIDRLDCGGDGQTKR